MVEYKNKLYALLPAFFILTTGGARVQMFKLFT